MARILIVDDEPDVRELFNITLKMAGHVTETAKHGLEAVDKLAADIPELIVLDLMMPHLDGFGLLNHIRNEMSSKPIRVLVATAKVLEESDQEKLGSWPVVGVLNKGELDIGQMVMIVTTALSQNPMKTGAPAAAPAAPAAPPVAGSSAPAGTSPAGTTPAPAASTPSPASPAPASPAPAPAAPAASPSVPATPAPAPAPGTSSSTSASPAPTPAPAASPSIPVPGPSSSESPSTAPAPSTPATAPTPTTPSPTKKEGA